MRMMSKRKFSFLYCVQEANIERGSGRREKINLSKHFEKDGDTFLGWRMLRLTLFPPPVLKILEMFSPHPLLIQSLHQHTHTEIPYERDLSCPRPIQKSGVLRSRLLLWFLNLWWKISDFATLNFSSSVSDDDRSSIAVKEGTLTTPIVKKHLTRFPVSRNVALLNIPS